MTDHHDIPIQGRKMSTYVFHVSLEPDGDGWRAFYAPLEHIGASTWGSTQEEAITHIHEVLSLIVDELLDEGKAIPAAEGLAVTSGAAVAITR
jgi:predicted RNase H-like HicB family nuclease